MTGLPHFDTRRTLHPVVGLPRDLPAREVLDSRFLSLPEEQRTTNLRLTDNMPIPDSRDRENYFAGRDLEYWLSGLYAVREMVSACPKLEAASKIRVLDFGGSTGRISRHITMLNPNIESWLCDININWVDWIHGHFNRPIIAFQNRPSPALPLESNTFDFICALSVFTHLDAEELGWLLELRRVLKPEGKLFVTVLDDPVWDSLRKLERRWLKNSLLGPNGNEEADRLIASTGIPERYVLRYSDIDAYNVNTFLSRDWICRKWGPLFSDLTFQYTKPDAIQSTVVLTK